MWNDEFSKLDIAKSLPLFVQIKRLRFGGGGGSTKVINERFIPSQTNLLDRIAGLMGGQVGSGITPYPGTMVPGITPLQQAGFGLMGGLSPLASGAMGYFGDVLGQTKPGAAQQYQQLGGQTLEQLMQPFDTASFTQQVMDPTKAYAMQTYQQDIMPMLMEKYGTSSKDSGALWNILGKQGANISTALGAQMAPYLYEGQQAQLNRQQQGVNQAMQMAQLPGSLLQQAGGIAGMGTDLVSQMLNAGAQQRGIAGEGLQEQASKYQLSQPYSNPWLTQYLGTILGTSPVSPYAIQSAPSAWSSMLPGLGSMLGQGISDMGLSGMAGMGSSLLGGLGGLGGAALGGLSGLGGAALGGLGALAGLI